MTWTYQICAQFSAYMLLSYMDFSVGISSLPGTTAQLCDAKSAIWNNELYSELEAACEPLTYDEQFCHIPNKTQWDCMRRRALMQNHKTCECHRDRTFYTEANGCLYAEICTFADPNFQCNRNYSCTVDGDNINCTAPGSLHYTNTCYRGFIFCPSNATCDITNLPFHYFTILKEECGDEYKKEFGSNVTIYYIDQVHFDNVSHGYGNISALILGDGDENNPCVVKGNDYSPSSTTRRADWKIIILVLVGFVAMWALIFGIWRLRQYYVRDNKKWNEIIDQSVRYVNDLIGNSGTIVASAVVEDDEETVDPIPPEGIQLPAPAAEDNSMQARNHQVYDEPPVHYHGDSGFCDFRNGGIAGSYDNEAYDRPVQSGLSGSDWNGPSVRLNLGAAGPASNDSSILSRDQFNVTPGLYEKLLQDKSNSSSSTSCSGNVAEDVGSPQSAEIPLESFWPEASPIDESLLPNVNEAVEETEEQADSATRLRLDSNNVDNKLYFV